MSEIDLSPEEARLALGLTVAQVAKKLRLSNATVRGYELHGTTVYEQAMRMAKFYKCSHRAFSSFVRQTEAGKRPSPSTTK